MLAKGVTPATLLAVAAEVGVQVIECRADRRRWGALRFRLAPIGETYRRLNWRLTQRLAAVCWHGHRDFFTRLFEVAPAAKVWTTHTRRFGPGYYSRATFENLYPQTGHVNIGSQFEPCVYADACRCDQEIFGLRRAPHVPAEGKLF